MKTGNAATTTSIGRASSEHCATVGSRGTRLFYVRVTSCLKRRQVDSVRVANCLEALYWRERGPR